MRLIIIGIDENICTTISGVDEIQDPNDQELKPFVKEATTFHQRQGDFLFAITNDDMTAAGVRSPEMSKAICRHLLCSMPSVINILVGDDFSGLKFSRYGLNRAEVISQRLDSKYGSFRLPHPGIVNFLLDKYSTERYNCWVIGGHNIFYKMAENADVNYCPTDAWLHRFSPGIHEHQLSMKQILFLENIRIL